MPQLDQVHTFASQIFWLVVTFTLLYLIVWRTALPRISDVVQERQRRIEEDVLKAEDLKREAETALAAYEESTAKARAEAQAILRESAERFAAEASRRHEDLSRRLAEETEASEARIAAARDEAMANVEAIATELAEAASGRLTGITVDPAAAKTAVAEAIEERG
jgi:F-type H+-transporting ATPase subunit b